VKKSKLVNKETTFFDNVMKYLEALVIYYYRKIIAVFIGPLLTNDKSME
jgi:hypothetical protein